MATAARTRPHILMIYSDQHRYDCVGANGHPLVRTPNLDRLARDGVNFSHAFTPVPMCVPARCSMLTGLWPSQHGVVFNYDGETFRRLDPALPTFARLVRDSGYHTFHIGRWHVDPERTPLDFGFHDYIPDWRYLKWRAAHGLPPAPRDGGIMGCTDPYGTPEQSALGWGAAQAIRCLERGLEEGDPIFLRWHMVEPHLICRPCEPFASMYDPAAIEPWPSFADRYEGKPYILRQMLETRGHGGLAWSDFARGVANYLAVVSQLDYAIGLVLDALERLGIADNTLVIYSSDHGDMCGSHRMMDKHYILYDDVVRVPLTMRWPGVLPAGRVEDAFVLNAVDLPATFCDAASVAAPASFAGQSLLPWARGEAAGRRGDIFATYSGNQYGAFSQRMVRDRRFKYVWNLTDVDEFYDLEADPWEMHNRIADPACAGEVARLRRRMVAWLEEVRDPLLHGATRRQLLEGAKLA